MPDLSATDTSALIACPSCDALYRAVTPENGARAVCGRCHHVLIAPVEGAIIRVVALSLAVLVMIATAIVTPFLSVEAAGLSHSSSVIEAALSFSSYDMIGLSIAVMTVIVFIPVLRALLLVFALAPLMFQRPPIRGARTAFRLSEELRPWSMAEIFVLCVGVALVKIADMARVEFGMAFWLFAGLVVVTVFQDGFLCRWSIWSALEADERKAQGDG